MSLRQAALDTLLPFREGDSLFVLDQSIQPRGTPLMLSSQQISDVRDSSTHFTHLSAFQGAFGTVATKNNRAYAEGVMVDPNFFEVLPAKGLLGNLSEAAVPPSGVCTVVVTYQFWVNRLHKDEDVIGAPFSLDDKQCIVRGVLPERFTFPFVEMSSGHPDFFMTTSVALGREQDYDKHALLRLEGGSAENVITNQQILDAYETTRNYSVPDRAKTYIQIRSYRDVLAGDLKPLFRLFTILLTSAVALVCVNVSSLLVLESYRYDSTMQIQFLLGASHRQAFRLLLSSTALVGGIGIICGCFISNISSWAAFPYVVNGPKPFLTKELLAFNFGYALIAGLVVLVLASCVPLGLLTQRVRSYYRTGHSTRIQGPGRGRQVLLAMQVGCSVALVIVAASVAFSLLHALAVDVGINLARNQVLIFRFEHNKEMSAKKREVIVNRAINLYQTIQGVERVGATTHPPLRPPSIVKAVLNDSSANPFDVETVATDATSLSSLGIRVMAGQGFGLTNADSASPTALINEEFAREYKQELSGSENRVCLPTAGVCRWRHIIGIVSNARDVNITQEAKPTLYVPLPQLPESMASDLVLVVTRSKGYEGLPNNPPIAGLSLLDSYELTSEARSQGSSLRLASWLLLFLSTMAVLLMSVGLFGVVSEWIEQERRNVAIRVALGATKLHVLALMFRALSEWMVPGVVIGVVFGYYLHRELSGVTVQLLPNYIGPTALSLVLFVLASGLVSLIAMREILRQEPATLLKA